jgi:tetratricopeptide (TPR) repeat protein
MRQRQPLDAQRALEAALEQDDTNAETYYLLGNTLDAQGQTTKAVEHYQRALELDPKLARAHNNLGSIVSSRDPALAIKHFEAALSVDPQYVEALGNLGNALARSGRYGDAISCYRRALEIRPDFAPARRNLAAVQQMLQPRSAP